MLSFVYQTHSPSLYLIQSVGVCMGGGNSEKLYTKLTEVVTSGERRRRPGLGIKDFNLIGNNLIFLKKNVLYIYSIKILSQN